MKKVTLILLSLLLLIGCKKEEPLIVTFISLNPSILYNNSGVNQLDVKTIVEFNSKTDFLIIGKQAHKYSDEDSIVPKFGLDSFYKYKIDRKQKDQMSKLLEDSYNDSFQSNFREKFIDTSFNLFDDRGAVFIVLQKDNKQEIIYYKESEKLPYEIAVIDSIVYNILSPENLVKTEFNISLNTINELHDFIYNTFPPPPLKSPVQFTVPIINK